MVSAISPIRSCLQKKKKQNSLKIFVNAFYMFWRFFLFFWGDLMVSYTRFFKFFFEVFNRSIWRCLFGRPEQIQNITSITDKLHLIVIKLSQLLLHSNYIINFVKLCNSHMYAHILIHTYVCKFITIINIYTYLYRQTSK